MPSLPHRRPGRHASSGAGLSATLAVAVLFGIAACAPAGQGKPVPTPADFGGISEVLQSRGVTILDVVSGDGGCPGNDLSKTAISFEASGIDQVTPVHVYLYVFHDHDTFVRLSSTVGTCAQTYVTDPSTYESLAISPYVLSGQGPWAPGFTEQMKEGLTSAAGDGGTTPDTDIQ
ncbi:MAG TPA: hypothetical protein VEG29_07810 [Candidatus Binatia bacterium]|nr:hypothetical protein [Candidatus Binatia bacterium]